MPSYTAVTKSELASFAIVKELFVSVQLLGNTSTMSFEDICLITVVLLQLSEEEQERHFCKNSCEYNSSFISISVDCIQTTCSSPASKQKRLFFLITSNTKHTTFYFFSIYILISEIEFEHNPELLFALKYSVHTIITNITLKIYNLNSRYRFRGHHFKGANTNINCSSVPTYEYDDCWLLDCGFVKLNYKLW